MIKIAVTDNGDNFLNIEIEGEPLYRDVQDMLIDAFRMLCREEYLAQLTEESDEKGITFKNLLKYKKGEQ